MTGVITNAGRDAIRDFIQSEVAEMGVGTGTDEPTKTDSTLQSEVTRKAVSKADGGTGEEVFTIRLSTSDANGNDLTEVGTFDTDGDLQARLTHSEIRKTDDFEVEYRLSETVVNT